MDMCKIPQYPDMVDFSPEIRGEIEPVLQGLTDGISELTYSSLIIHKEKYNYRISKTSDGFYLLFREKNGQKCFIPLNGIPESTARDLLAKNYKMIFVPQDMKERYVSFFAEQNFELVANRDDADYVYLRKDLVDLKGKQFHKKKNHLNAFLKNYEAKVSIMDTGNKADAEFVLEKWYGQNKNIESDYHTAKKAIKLFEELNLFGIIVYVNESPVGFALGEYFCNGTMFCTHFEKGLNDINGIYQFLNWKLACMLDENTVYINREQDLGDEGMRQAKMTYRPVKFIEKYCTI